MEPVRVGVWGVGVWGEKHARVYRALSESGIAELVGVHDLRSDQAERVAAAHGTRVFDDVRSLLDACEAVSVAVPTVGHREAVDHALAAGCHVLVEKPMASTVAEAEAMVVAAARSGRVLQVGQVERFNPALLAARGEVERPKFIEAHRLAMFQPRSLDIDVVFDLMIHDIDVVLRFVGSFPTSVSAVGVAVLSLNEDIANARLEFEDGCVANLTASRVSPERLRRIRFFQADAYTAVDLFEHQGEVTRVDLPAFRAAGGDPLRALQAIHKKPLAVEAGEPLRLELQAFLESLRGRNEGAASARAGRDALQVAETVRDAMKQRAVQWTAP